MITYKEYYLQQIKEIPVIWKLAKEHKMYKEFFKSISLLLLPMVIYIMYLYDTEQIEVDKRFNKKE